MSVLAEAISIVIQKRTLDSKYPGGASAYREQRPNATYCEDAYLTRVGFMRPQDVQFFVGQLQLHGIAFGSEAGTRDMCVVDQHRGATLPCPWIEFEKQEDGISHCWLSGRPRGDLVTPRGWTAGSMRFAEPGDGQLRAHGGHDGLDVFQDDGGKAAFVGGPFNKASAPEALEEFRRKATEPDARWEEGARLGGSWPIYQTLRGGMGIVMIVHDKETDRLLAAKTFQDAAFDGPHGSKIVERFKQEARVWIALGSHPNIVEAHRIREIAGKPYLFLEYVGGGSLAEWIGTNELIHNHDQAVKFGLDLCAGMHFACNNGLQAHRDLKPDNCMLTKDGRLKVTDFGLARAVTENAGITAQDHRPKASEWLKSIAGMFGASDGGTGEQPRSRATQAGCAMGTPPYMSPEQFTDSASVDIRTDIYAFGVMMYEMLSGRLPFAGRSFEEFARLHSQTPPPRLSSISPSLWRGIAKCLEKRPDDRFQDFGGVERWLRSTLTPGRVHTPPASHEKAESDAISRGLSAANLGDFVEALRWLDQAIDQSPENAEAWTHRGKVLEVMGKPDAALESHDRAITLRPDVAPVWHAKGVTLNSLGRLEDALRCYDRSLRLNSADPNAWYDKGVVLQRLDRASEAAKCWDHCLQIHPEHSMAWCNRGAVYKEQGNHDEAVSCFKRALTIDSRDKFAWFNLGTSEALRGNFAEAIRCLETADKLGMPNAGAAKQECRKLLQARGRPS
jgi:eukaryotic-like serine/threonine-protein kinase